jgi:transcriptional regulator with XRE-family HTH domain
MMKNTIERELAMSNAILDKREIGLTIKRVRELTNISQKELARRVGLKSAHISHLETGRRSPSTEIAIALCVALHIQPNQLFGFVNLPRRARCEKCNGLGWIDN